MHTRSFPAKAGNDGYARTLGARKKRKTKNMKITSIAEFKELLFDLLTKNPEKGFEHLRSNLKKDSQHYKETILIYARYNKIKNEIRQGTAHMSDFTSDYNSILMAAINLINDLEISDLIPQNIVNIKKEQTIINLKNQIKDLDSQLSQTTNPSLQSTFLRRRDIVGEYHIFNLLKKAKKEIIIRAMCLTITKTGGLFYKFISSLDKNPDLKIKILLYNIFDSKATDIIDRATLVPPEEMKKDILDVQKRLKELPENLKTRVSFALYDSFPTSSIILVDPDEEYGIGKFELFVYPFQPPEEKLNVVLKKEQDVEYFNEVHESIKKELKNNIQL